MNTKENTPKDTKQAKKSIETKSPGKSKNTTLNKNIRLNKVKLRKLAAKLIFWSSFKYLKRNNKGK